MLLLYAIIYGMKVIVWRLNFNNFSNNTTTPNPPTTRLAFFGISDIPPNPTPIIRSIATKSYASTNFEYWEDIEEYRLFI
jgi:hypothetical protein